MVLVHYPYTSFEQTKLRPALVLSNEVFNQKHAFVILCPVTSRKTLPEYEMEVVPDLFSGKLQTQSFVRCDNLMSIDKEIIIDEIGKLDQPFLEKVLEKVAQNFA